MSLENSHESLRTDRHIPLAHLQDNKVVFVGRKGLGIERLCTLLTSDDFFYVRTNGHFHLLQDQKLLKVPQGPTFTLLKIEKVVLVSKGMSHPQLMAVSSPVLETERSAWRCSLSEQDAASLKAVQSNRKLAVLAALGLAVLGGMAVGLKQCVDTKVDQEAASD